MMDQKEIKDNQELCGRTALAPRKERRESRGRWDIQANGVRAGNLGERGSQGFLALQEHQENQGWLMSTSERPSV